PRMWTFASGEPSVVADVMDSFGVSSLGVGDEDILHNTRLLFIDRDGIVRKVVRTDGWDPVNVASSVRGLAGLSSNPARNFWFETFAEINAICGGNGGAAIVVMLCIAIPLIASITIPILVWFGRRIFSDRETKQRPAS
ncbi:MAG: hypothetical protein ACREJX_12375, partial [Polyangiaceae bacterium]